MQSQALTERADGPRRPRIFWFGMHKVLVETEFRLLQDMGYEVFRPPYLSRIVDQSVSTSSDFGNASLPDDVLAVLSTYDFFYNAIAPEVSRVLAEHFDAIVVTINADWLRAALQVFPGTVIYRCYGQIGRVSESLRHNGSRPLIAQRENFHFMPHAPECLDDEDLWLVSHATVVPYWLTADVLAMGGAWRKHSSTRNASIAVACPNITNDYYNAHFRYLKRHFEERCFRYYGVQVEPNADFNVVGSLPRGVQLMRLSNESGFLYTYRERNVCYLPPIEMMLIGGPVLYFPGSLLARCFGKSSPGVVEDEAEAIGCAKRLIRGDTPFVDDIVASQAQVAYRYTPEFGEEIFRLTFERLIPIRAVSPTSGFQPESSQRVLVIAHIGGYIVNDGHFSAIHGIPRVMRQFVRALNDRRVPVSVTYEGSDRTEIHGFYASQCDRPDLIESVDLADILALPDPDLRETYGYAVVAHYHMFPAVNELRLPLLAYVPDYLPHFFEGRGWFAQRQDDIDCGRRLATVARRVLTNSRFSQSYLPNSKLCIPAERITVFPLPFLGSTSAGPEAPRPPSIPEVLASEPYVFYPTQPHPHKRLDLLVMSWLLVNRTRTAPVRLVLTAGFVAPRVLDLIEASSLTSYLHLLPAIDDTAVEWLYAQARCLAFSSELEGNFPTQVLEALHLDCPVVCTDNPLIVTELGELAHFLQMTPFGDVEAFAKSIAYCIDHRDDVLHRQRLVKIQILHKFSYELFSANVAELHRHMTFAEEQNG